MQSESEEHLYWLGLSLIEGLGPVRMSKLIQHFDSPRKIWQATRQELARVDGITALAGSIIRQRKQIDPHHLLSVLARKEIEYLTLTDQGYPALLKEIYDPPPVIYYRGQPLSENPAVAIVGSRRSTAYGRKIAKKLASEIAARGLTVISGMARGIDTCGHLGALKAGGGTVAVLGSGLDVIYPPENKTLFSRIMEQGTVISEFPPGVQPLPGNFPRRNRIISGLSLGVVVIEASSRSGSLITARLALEQGRELFAVPGNINRPGSRGTNELIKNGAKMVTCLDDVLEELFLYNSCQQLGNGVTTDFKQARKRTVYPELSPDEKKVIEVLQQEGELHINQIIVGTGKTAAEVNTLLLKLELKGLVAREAGKKYSFLGLQNLLKPL